MTQGSSFMQDGLTRENGPFDEAYESLLYGEALALFDESRDLQEQGDNLNKCQRAIEHR
jgi:hypothetical protein